MEREHPEKFQLILNKIAQKIPGVNQISTEKSPDGRLLLKFNDRGFQDPFQAYVERIKLVSKKPLDDEFSGLGLARISYEGKGIVDFFLGDNNQLNVSVVSNF